MSLPKTVVARDDAAPPRRLRCCLLVLSFLVAGTTSIVNASEAAAVAPCALGGGWAPLGQVAPAVPGVTDFELVRFADLDGDGDDDRLLLDEISGVRQWRNDRDGRWSYLGRTAMGTGYPPTRVKFADLNGDGRDDYLVVKDDGALDAWINEGGDLAGSEGTTPGWRGVGQIARGTGAPADLIYFGDIDGDGDDDYWSQPEPTGAMELWRNDGGDRPGHDGWTLWGRFARIDVPGLRFEFADVDCDGRDDRTILRPDSSLHASVDIRIISGSWTYKEVSPLARGTGDPADRVRLAELNGDGRVDYLVMAGDGSVVGYRNNGGDAA